MKSNYTINSFARSIIYFIALSIVFYYPGFRYHGVFIDIPLILIMIFTIVTLVSGSYNQKDLLFIGTFIGWCLLSVIFRYPPQSYLFSLLFTSALILPLGFNFRKINIDIERLINYMIIGVLLSVLFIPFELIFRYYHLLGFNGNELWLTFGGKVFKYYRASSTMMEPSHYTTVLTFIYIITDIAKRRGYKIKRLIIFRYSYFLVLILAASLSGIALFSLYFFLKIMFYFVGIIQHKYQIHLKKRLLTYILVGFVMILITNVLSDNFIKKIAYKIHDRVLATKDAIVRQKSEGSSGVRSSFIWVSGMYVANSTIGRTLIGEGYSNYHNWLQKNAKKIGYDSGEVYNLYFVVFLSTGLVGVLSFLMMILKVLNTNFLDQNDLAFMFILLASFLTHGYLIMYWVFLPIIFYKLIPIKEDSDFK